MSATASWEERLRPGALGRIAIPVGLAVLTWLLLLLVVGQLLRFEGLLSLFSFVLIGVLVAPLWHFTPWQPGVTARVLDWAGKRRVALLVTGLLLVLAVLPPLASRLGPLTTILQFPLQASGVFYSATLPYRRLVAPALGVALLKASQFYVQCLWLYVIGVALARFGAVVRGPSDA